MDICPSASQVNGGLWLSILCVGILRCNSVSRLVIEVFELGTNNGV